MYIYIYVELVTPGGLDLMLVTEWCVPVGKGMLVRCSKGMYTLPKKRVKDRFFTADM